MAEQAQAEQKQETAPTKRGAPPRLKELYDSKVAEHLAESRALKNPMERPKLEKIVLNVNMGRHLDGTKIPANIKEHVVQTLRAVSGQKPVVLKAKKSVSNFKVRAGYDTAAMVTLRREKMWHFLDRFINLYTPRIRDFRGLSDKAFDGRGNYSTGVSEQAIFPEIDMGKASFTHGMNINFVFSNSNPELSKEALGLLGMPFKRPEEKKEG